VKIFCAVGSEGIHSMYLSTYQERFSYSRVSVSIPLNAHLDMIVLLSSLWAGSGATSRLLGRWIIILEAWMGLRVVTAGNNQPPKQWSNHTHNSSERSTNLSLTAVSR